MPAQGILFQSAPRDHSRGDIADSELFLELVGFNPRPVISTCFNPRPVITHGATNSIWFGHLDTAVSIRAP